MRSRGGGGGRESDRAHDLPRHHGVVRREGKGDACDAICSAEPKEKGTGWCGGRAREACIPSP